MSSHTPSPSAVFSVSLEEILAKELVRVLRADPSTCEKFWASVGPCSPALASVDQHTADHCGFNLSGADEKDLLGTALLFHDSSGDWIVCAVVMLKEGASKEFVEHAYAIDNLGVESIRTAVLLVVKELTRERLLSRAVKT